MRDFMGIETPDHVVLIVVNAETDPAERSYFKGLPTSFVLKDEEVDKLREIGRKLLRDAPAFKKLLAELR